MIYYTGKGDKGKSIVGKRKVAKDSLIMETLGELDEFNSLLGLAKNYLPKKFFEKLTEIQNNLFIIQANVAYVIYSKFKPPELKKEKIENLEKEIKEIEQKIKPRGGFILYGSDKDSAWFDYLRAETRRVERKMLSFQKRYKLKENILSYLNRLSSYFYALGREMAYNKKKKEKSPWYDKN